MKKTQKGWSLVDFIEILIPIVAITFLVLTSPCSTSTKESSNLDRPTKQFD